ncbi:DNA polymerase III subunit gamma/tau [Candidatus Parcubacteria bacterium]|nr:DNA polymerase III subunit gamma/tau [Candidatus Parcubacteria bacterium]
MTEEYQALYRKYRPERFKDVVGQDHIVKVLEGSINLGNISHAYLFSGSRGTGKTSIARIFAKEIGTSTNDLYEIDAASNRGIDDIREIREGVNTLPFESKYKVYIIDEVHMLTKEAFNALLKTLEEPPPHAVFILATTETDKLPETVVSRCQTFSFKKPSQKILKDMVMSVTKKEGYSLDSASAELIALLGDGSFRDTQGIIQKVISSSKDKKISQEEVEMVTGAPRGELINNFISALDQKSPAAGLSALKKASDQNIDIHLFIKLVLHKLRAILLLRYSPDMTETLQDEFSGEDFTFLKQLAEKKESHINSKTILELLKAEAQVKFSPIPELPIELAVAELGAKSE